MTVLPNRTNYSIRKGTAIRIFTIGLISILGQVVLLRELNVAFYGIELIYTLAIGIWLIWSGIGTLLGLKKEKPSLKRINLLFLLLSIAVPAGTAFIRAIRLLFSGTPGAYLPLDIQIFATAASLLPFGLLLGLLFRWTAKIYIESGRSLAAAYAVESAGGIAGGIVATLFLKFGIQNFTAGLICALTAALLPLLSSRGTAARLLQGAAACVTLLLLLSLWNTREIDYRMTSWTHPNLVVTQDSPYSRITVTRLEQQSAVFENDTLIFNSEETHSEEFVHLAALQRPTLEKVLVLGGGIEGILTEIQAYSPDIVDYVELNPVILEIARTRITEKTRTSLEAENVRVYIDDPRSFLATAAGYDLILVGMPEPFSGQANRFYTLEFFRQAAAALNSEGVLAFRLPSSDNYMSYPMIQRMTGVYRAAKLSLPEIMVLPGMSSIFLCSRNSLPEDASIIASRMRSRGLRSAIVTEPYLRYLYTNNRFKETAELLHTTEAPVNTDSRPMCYRYTLMIWLSKFWPSLSSRDYGSFEKWDTPTTYSMGIILIAIPAAFLYGAGWVVRRTVIMGVAGFSGMVLETILLLRFQIKNGILFQDLGVLLTSFMLGLLLGAITLNNRKRIFPRRTGIAIFTGFILLGGIIALSVQADVGSSLTATYLLLMTSGFLVASTFAYAGLRDPDNQSGSVVALYSADLVGGGLGSLLAGTLLVPITGLEWTALVLIPITAFALLLVLKK